ncbi:MAG: hypothetical protein RIR79_1300 [Pseudomonadota bacterium]|jgi:hypothetical protein
MTSKKYTALPSRLLSRENACVLIDSGAFLIVAADEDVLASLPCGNWIGGTIPYFMGQNGGVTTRKDVFVTPIRWEDDLEPSITTYDAAMLSQICVEAPENGYSTVVLPAFSDVHIEYAENAPQYDDMYIKPVVGWISGIHLDDMGKRSPKVRDGRTTELLDNVAVVMHVPLPNDTIAQIQIINLFSQGYGDVLEFEQSGFEVQQCRVNGRLTSFATYLQSTKHDTRLPIVANYSGALINVSIKVVDVENDVVSLYAPVFPRMQYKLAKSFVGSYEDAFHAQATQLQGNTQFACNCVLNYLYSNLEGKRTDRITGPMTFGEIAYVLLNQTLVQLTLRSS